MKNHFAIHFDDRMIHKVFLFFLAAALSVSCISLLAAQQKDKKKKKDSTPAADSSNMLIPMSDEQQIDYMLSEMLGAWQLGDIEKLHKDYADDVSVVNGSWAPPVIGWTNYLAIYQQQRARMQQVRMDRLNTYIKVNGATGWACYQFRGDCGWPAGLGPGPGNGGLREAQQSLGYRAQSHVARAESPAGSSSECAFRSAAARQAAATLKLGGGLHRGRMI